MRGLLAREVCQVFSRWFKRKPDPARIVPRLLASDRASGDGDAVQVDIAIRTPPLSPPLAIAYAYDESDDDPVLRFLSSEEQRALSLSDDQLYKLAVSNMTSKVGPLQLHSAENYHAFSCGGLFEATLLLVDSVWERVERELTDGESIVAAVPAKDLLFFTSRSNERGLSELRELLAKIAADGNLTLSRHLFTREARRWYTL